MCRPSPTNCVIFQQGFTLLEVMISTIILTVSLFGVAGMYGFASGFSYEAGQHTQAIYVANNVLERLRMNKTAWQQSVLLTDNNSYQLIMDNQHEISVSPACKTIKEQNCHNADIIRHDLNDWQQHIINAFPSSPVHVCLLLNKKQAERTIDVVLTIDWLINRADKSDPLPVLNDQCGQNKSGRRQYMVKTRL